MTDHDCIQREDISSLKTSVDRINKEMFNGDGIIKQVPVLCHQVTELTEAVRDLKTALSGLNIFMSETKGGRVVFKNAVPWIAVMIAAITLAFSILRSNKIKEDFNEDQARIERRLDWKQDKPISTQERSITVKKDSLQQIKKPAKIEYKK